jgi:hypothetical protein
MIKIVGRVSILILTHKQRYLAIARKLPETTQKDVKQFQGTSWIKVVSFGKKRSNMAYHIHITTDWRFLIENKKYNIEPCAEINVVLDSGKDAAIDFLKNIVIVKEEVVDEHRVNMMYGDKMRFRSMLEQSIREVSSRRGCVYFMEYYKFDVSQTKILHREMENEL